MRIEELRTPLVAPSILARKGEGLLPAALSLKGQGIEVLHFDFMRPPYVDGEGLSFEDFRFEPGRPGWNKGMRQEDYMSPEAVERSAATRFKKGGRPWNLLPVGSEFVDADGYVYVKVRDDPGGRRFAPGRSGNWVPKQALVYEEAHGGPAPADCMLAFADGDRRNFAPDNIVAVPRRLWTVINCRGLPYYDAGTLRVAMATAEVMSAAYAAERRMKEET